MLRDYFPFLFPALAPLERAILSRIVETVPVEIAKILKIQIEAITTVRRLPDYSEIYLYMRKDIPRFVNQKDELRFGTFIGNIRGEHDEIVQIDCLVYIVKGRLFELEFVKRAPVGYGRIKSLREGTFRIEEDPTIV